MNKVSPLPPIIDSRNGNEPKVLQKKKSFYEKMTSLDRKERFNVAKKYREDYMMPRYVIDIDEKTEKKQKRKLEPGEIDPNSKLYSIFAPISDLSDFGRL